MACAEPNAFHWADLRNHPREKVLLHEGVNPSSDSRTYEVTYLNSVYIVDPEQESIVELSPKPDRELTEMFQILLIQYMISDHGGPLTGKEISEKDLPGGVTFFQGPHALHVKPIAKRFGTDPEGFETAATKLGATPVDHGDKGMKFHPFPMIPVTYVLWAADDEFPASVSVLFDGSLERRFTLDMVFALVWTLTERIVEV
jgi:hypothetical protein